MSHNSLSLWKKTRLQARGLPPPPPHLNEPAYANLLFSPHCHVSYNTGFRARGLLTYLCAGLPEARNTDGDLASFRQILQVMQNFGVRLLPSHPLSS